MKMAKASKADLDMALELSRMIESLEQGYMPAAVHDEEAVRFDRYDPDDCQRVVEALLDTAGKGSLFRVTFGMAVLLDPRNKAVDPDADTLAIHPEHLTNAKDAQRYRDFRAAMAKSEVGFFFRIEEALKLIGVPESIAPNEEQIDAAFDAAIAKQGKEE